MVGVRKSLDSGAVVKLAGLVILALLMTMVVSADSVASPPRYELVRSFAPDGSSLTGFESAGPVAVDQQSHTVYAADGKAGRIYKFDGNGTPVDWSGSSGYLSGNALSGLSFSEVGQRQIAVDVNSHIIYVTSGGSVLAFAASGEPSVFTAGPGAGSNALSGFSTLAGVAVDVNGYIYASDRTEELVKVFAPTGEQVTQFTVGNPANLAVDSAGAVYVTSLFSTVQKATPSTFPVTPATTYSVATFNQQGSYSVGVDPATNNVYVTLLNGEPGVAVYNESGNILTTFGEASEEGELFIADGIAIDPESAVPNEALRVYVGNIPTEGISQVNIYRPEPPKAPVIENLAAATISSTTASLYALINPKSVATTYRFEYGPEDCSVSPCSVTPFGGASIGSGNDGVAVAQEIKGLEPDTEYHYRVVAENALGVSEMKSTFRTQRNSLGFGISDERVWEMVSPAQKHGALLIGSASGQVQAAPDGNGIAYLSNAPIDVDPEGSRSLESASIIARRNATGWLSDNIASPNSAVTPPVPGQGGEYKLFSIDLSKALLDPRSRTLLSVEASERGPYLRENVEPPLYKPLVTGKEGIANVPLGTEFGGGEAFISAVRIQHATPDLSHVILQSGVPLVKDAPPSTIYEWVSGALKPISVLPADEEEGKIVTALAAGSGRASVRNAISVDGSRIYWTRDSLESGHLYMRDMEAGQTVRVDEVRSGSGEGQVKPIFQGASADGTIVFFTDTQRLTADASPSGADLYRCEIPELASGCVGLTNLTTGSGEAAEVLGIVSGLSNDASRLYFVAKGALTDAANQLGRLPQADEPNLYFWQEGKGLRFIATLNREDRAVWGLPGTESPPGLAAGLGTAVSPSGRYFAFMSERNLTDPSSASSENIDVVSGRAVQEVYRYDAERDRLDCISCAPTGSAPQGTLVGNNPLVDPQNQWLGRYVAAVLPQPPMINLGGITIYHPRVALDNGRVFFHAFDAIVPADSNKQWDIYQFEDTGVGDCGATASGGAIVQSGSGCISLISSGTGMSETGFLDASVTGDDAFFLSPARLSVTDVDDELDVYDARVGGQLAIADAPSSCSGESCRTNSIQQPDLAPGSASFSGPGNVKTGKKCPKGKRKVKGGRKQHCVRHKSKKRHRRGRHHQKGVQR